MRFRWILSRGVEFRDTTYCQWRPEGTSVDGSLGAMMSAHCRAYMSSWALSPVLGLILVLYVQCLYSAGKCVNIHISHTAEIGKAPKDTFPKDVWWKRVHLHISRCISRRLSTVNDPSNYPQHISLYIPQTNTFPLMPTNAFPT